MARALVVCPTTGDLELIEYAGTPLGALIHACSRFHPRTALACGRPCARGELCDLGRNDECAVADDPCEDAYDTELEISAASEAPRQLAAFDK